MSAAATAARRLRVILIEDAADDAELLLRELRRGGFTVESRRVDTEAGLRAALAEAPPWQLAISDFTMPLFDAPRVLGVLQELAPELPCIIVSGTIGEEAAVDSLRAGARDFIVKGRLARLLPAIERELREAELRRERREAEALAAAALQAAQRAQAASEAKSRVLASVSHELRSPLHAILGFAELLGLGVGGALSERHADFVENITLSGRHLLGVVNDLLDVSRIEAGRMPLDLRPTDGASIAREVLEMLAPQALRKGVVLQLQEPAEAPPIAADALRLRQILVNLVGNAIKCTPRGGEVSVCIERLDQASARLLVRDTGVGIAEEDLPRLFRDFEQLAAGRGSDQPGSGLGLALTRQLVELMHGRIEVQSRLGHGSSFAVLLPLAAGEQDHGDAAEPGLPPRAARATRPLSRRRRILVVDDDAPSRRLVRAILEEAGHEVVEAADAGEGLRAAGEDAPDLVVADVGRAAGAGVTGGGGAMLLRELRRRPELLAVPLVATTTLIHRGDREQLLADGFDGYVSKPIAADELRAMIEILLSATPPEAQPGPAGGLA